MTALVILEAVVIGLLLLLVVGLLRSHGEILRALRDLGIELDPGASAAHRPDVPQRAVEGVDASDIVGVTPKGSERAVGVVGVAHSTLLAFLSTGCLTCADFWKALRADDELKLPGTDTRLVVVTKGPEAESPAEVAKLAPRHLTTIMSTEAWDRHGIPVTPYFVLVDGPSGSIAGEGAAASWSQLERLLAKAAADGGILGSSRPRERGGGTRERVEAVDEILASHGVTPGHPSLHARAEDEEEESGP